MSLENSNNKIKIIIRVGQTVDQKKRYPNFADYLCCLPIGNCRNVKGLGKSKVVFRLFEKLSYSNKRSTKFESFTKNRSI